ncbi:hypothetical protein L1987_58736 [Smallanthus sonchifolius]|uniref:Uncharacterized protein n=1 Tax=Smallanthus sonchifolius TaxID=185202 RepID=A0ACB9D3A0_9ASTR|nr:hypothetical protein L1987_58736 [Smallanthus sonchifolius]
MGKVHGEMRPTAISFFLREVHITGEFKVWGKVSKKVRNKDWSWDPGFSLTNTAGIKCGGSVNFRFRTQLRDWFGDKVPDLNVPLTYPPPDTRDFRQRKFGKAKARLLKKSMRPFSLKIKDRLW